MRVLRSNSRTSLVLAAFACLGIGLVASAQEKGDAEVYAKRGGHATIEFVSEKVAADATFTLSGTLYDGQRDIPLDRRDFQVVLFEIEGSVGECLARKFTCMSRD